MGEDALAESGGKGLVGSRVKGIFYLAAQIRTRASCYMQRLTFGLGESGTFDPGQRESVDPSVGLCFGGN